MTKEREDFLRETYEDFIDSALSQYESQEYFNHSSFNAAEMFNNFNDLEPIEEDALWVYRVSEVDDGFVDFYFDDYGEEIEDEDDRDDLEDLIQSDIVKMHKEELPGAKEYFRSTHGEDWDKYWEENEEKLLD